MTVERHIAVEWVVRGRVQGVGFRAYTMHRARQEGVKGHVANKPDGSVLIYAEGSVDAIRAMESWIRRGPALARVDDIEETRHEPTGRFATFEVRG